MGIGFGLDLSNTISNNVRLRLRDSGDDGLSSDITIRIENEETNELVEEFYGNDWGSEITYGPFDLEDGSYTISFEIRTTTTLRRPFGILLQIRAGLFAMVA